MTVIDDDDDDREPDDEWSLGQTREWLQHRIETGVTCPCCDQFAKIYRRTLPNATARVMIELWCLDNCRLTVATRAVSRLAAENELAFSGRAWTFLPELLDTMTGTPHQGGYGTLGQFWGLLEQKPATRSDGSSRAGWWRLTDNGTAFVLERMKVPRYAHLFNGRCLKTSGKPWSIRDALGTKFNYDELMNSNDTLKT